MNVPLCALQCIITGMNKSLRLLAVLAHPDDELAAGGTLAKYARNGAYVAVVCATRGEAATIFCEDCATRETLAHVRTGELECACQALGVQHVLWLDWPDGGVDTIPVQQASAQLTAIIRELRPHVLLSHPEHGTYPHPDHIAVHERVAAAYEAAANPTYLPETGPAWAVPKFYVRAMPETFFDLIPGFRDYRVNLNGQALPFHADPPEYIDCTIDCTESVDYRIKGWACHRSQHNPNGTFSTMSAEQQRAAFQHEHFRLLSHHLTTDPAPHDSLYTGLAEFDHA